MLGDIARALEVFRRAAIRNDELEAAAQTERAKAERERVDAQARAEREAEARLNQATASLAAGLRKLAAGDLLCEINEAFAQQFEALRRDFNSSVKTLRETLISVGGAPKPSADAAPKFRTPPTICRGSPNRPPPRSNKPRRRWRRSPSNVSSTSKRAAETRDTVRDTRAAPRTPTR